MCVCCMRASLESPAALSATMRYQYGCAVALCGSGIEGIEGRRMATQRELQTAHTPHFPCPSHDTRRVVVDGSYSGGNYDMRVSW